MKISISVLSTALLLLAILAVELVVGVRWSLQSWNLPDFDLKLIRPIARFAFTGFVVTFTIIFGGALVRAMAIRDN